jgi:hypothetical protein
VFSLIDATSNDSFCPAGICASSGIITVPIAAMIKIILISLIAILRQFRDFVP